MIRNTEILNSMKESWCCCPQEIWRWKGSQENWRKDLLDPLKLSKELDSKHIDSLSPRNLENTSCVSYIVTEEVEYCKSTGGRHISRWWFRNWRAIVRNWKDSTVEKSQTRQKNPKGVFGTVEKLSNHRSIMDPGRAVFKPKLVTTIFRWKSTSPRTSIKN